jgi:hypothetical protein
MELNCDFFFISVQKWPSSFLACIQFENFGKHTRQQHFLNMQCTRVCVCNTHASAFWSSRVLIRRLPILIGLAVFLSSCKRWDSAFLPMLQFTIAHEKTSLMNHTDTSCSRVPVIARALTTPLRPHLLDPNCLQAAVPYSLYYDTWVSESVSSPPRKPRDRTAHTTIMCRLI